MKEYNFDNLKVDTQEFLKTEFGVYVMQVLEAKKASHMGNIMNPSQQNRLSYVDRFAEITEVIDFIRQGLDDDIPSHG